MRLAFGGNKGDFSFAHSSNRATCGKYIVEREKREKEIEILVVRLHSEGRSFKKCDVAVKPKNNVFIWFTFTQF